MFTRLRVSCPWGTVDSSQEAWRSTRALALAVIGSLSALAALPSYSHAARSRLGRHATAAPLLRVRGQALEWTRAGRHNKYKLLIKAPGEREIVTVTGRSYKPPLEPGTRVVYRVRAAFNESRWSNKTTIRYPGGTEELERPREVEPPREERPSTEHQGKVKYRLDAASYFDSFATPQFSSWAQAHVSLVKGYPPFGDIYMSLFGLPVIGYHDPATEGQAPLAQSGVENYVGKVARDMQSGYAGVFIDDANWSPGFTPSPGPRANLANLIEAVKTREPRATIEINSQYRDIGPLVQAGDPDVARALRYVSKICVEFGVGPTSGIGSPQEYEEFMRYADTLHAKGIGLTLSGDRYNNNVPTMEYNLATYFLINNGLDYITGTDQTPARWWGGFNVDLGGASSPREALAGGVWTRRFAHGVVYTVAPGAGAYTINLSHTMYSAEWGSVQSVTLAGGQGAVLSG
jgi:hypothetical protein